MNEPFWFGIVDKQSLLTLAHRHYTRPPSDGPFLWRHGRKTGPPIKEARTILDTMIAVMTRDDLATWQKLNVTALMLSGITGANPGIVGKSYENRDGKRHKPYQLVQ